MNFLVIILIFGMYISLSSKLNDLKQRTDKRKKSFLSLKELVGKSVRLEFDDGYDVFLEMEVRGVLKEFDDKWIVLETTNKGLEKELYYYLINNVVVIDVEK